MQQQLDAAPEEQAGSTAGGCSAETGKAKEGVREESFARWDKVLRESKRAVKKARDFVIRSSTMQVLRKRTTFQVSTLFPSLNFSCSLQSAGKHQGG